MFTSFFYGMIYDSRGRSAPIQRKCQERLVLWSTEWMLLHCERGNIKIHSKVAGCLTFNELWLSENVVNIGKLNSFADLIDLWHRTGGEKKTNFSPVKNLTQYVEKWNPVWTYAVVVVPQLWIRYEDFFAFESCTDIEQQRVAARAAKLSGGKLKTRRNCEENLSSAEERKTRENGKLFLLALLLLFSINFHSHFYFEMLFFYLYVLSCLTPRLFLLLVIFFFMMTTRRMNVETTNKGRQHEFDRR